MSGEGLELRGIALPEHRVPGLEGRGGIQVERLEYLAREIHWREAGRGDHVAVSNGRNAAVKRRPAVSAGDEVFASVAGVAEMIEQAGARQRQCGRADGRNRHARGDELR